MKILDIELVGYIGLYAKMGLKNLYIDLSKGTYRITAIKGLNGYGKSTLLNSLHILPDSNDNFLPNEEASKKLHVQDGDNIYYIEIKHGIKDNGSRETTKAYITKNGTQMNTNGNVGSYKEFIDNEFYLDANFLALSKLSSEDRGIVDKTPAERKKYVNSIISNLEIYNSINKTLVQRKKVFKSMINNLVSKLDNIGDEEKIKLSLESIQKRIDSFLNEKDNCLLELASSKNKIQLLDPDGTIQSSYDVIYKSLSEINIKIEDIDNKINRLSSKTNVERESVTERYNSIKDIIGTLEIDIKVNESNINNLLQNRENEAKELQSKSTKLESLKMETNYIDLERTIKDTENNIEEYLTIIKEIGFENVDNISREEFIVGLNTMKDIKESIDTFRSGMTLDVMRKAIEYHTLNSYPNIDELEKNIDTLKEKRNQVENEIEKYHVLKQLVDKISDRPSNCKIDSCPYIEDGVKASYEMNKIDIDNSNDLLRDINKELVSKVEELYNSKEVVNEINHLKIITRAIENNLSIIRKLPIDMDIFSTRDLIFKAILDGYSFKEIDILYGYIEYANIIEEYKTEKSKLDLLYNDYKLYEAKNRIVEDIIQEIDKINKNMSSISTEIEGYTNSIIENKNKLSSFKSLILDIEELLGYYGVKDNLMKNKNELISQYSVIKNNIITIKEAVNKVTECENRIDNISKQISPLIKDRDILYHNLQLSGEYNRELALYKAKSERIETIRKYCNPSQDGIQLVFIDIYMNKTISMANELLSLMFDGEYALGQMSINGDEFRIPCVSSLITCDDISSMSTSQKCMISMIISFVLLYQSSSKYNILRIDEIDGGLDNYNRLRFFPVLNELMDILGVEQVFMISHNEELSLDECNVILLKEYAEITNNINENNIIYRYAG